MYSGSFCPCSLNKGVNAGVVLCGQALASAQAAGAHNLAAARAVDAAAAGCRIDARADAVAAHQVASALAVVAPAQRQR